MSGFGRIFLVVCLMIFPAVLSAGEPVERIAAVVNGEIVFLSDLQRHRFFFEPLEKEGEASNDLQKALDAVIHHRLLLKEARRFVLQGPTEEEIDQRLKSIRRRFKTELALVQALNQAGFSLEEFKEEIREYLWVERLIQERIQSFIFITPRQVEQYYQGHPQEFKDKKLVEVEPKIRKFLIEERETLKTREYLARLREHADIQINLTAPAEATPPGQSSPAPPGH